MSDFLRLLVSLSLSGGALTLLVAILNRMLRGKIPRTFLYYLWLLVLARFLLPVGMEWSLLNRLVSPPEIVQEEAGLPSTGNIASATHSEPAQNVSVISQPETSVKPHMSTEPDQKKDIAWKPSLSVILIVVWGMGVLVCISWKIHGYKHLNQDLWQNMRPIFRWERKLLYAQAEGMRIRPSLRRSAAAQSPMLVGLLEPVIWLPNETIDTVDLSYALRHELIHFKRCDLWLKWAAVLTACFHWFNPMAWYLVYAMDRDCELSCDEWVVKGLSSQERASYGELLLRYAVGDSSTGSFFASFGNQKKMMRERLQIIVRKNLDGKKARVLLAAAAAVVILAGVILGSYAFQIRSNDVTPKLSSLDGFVQNGSEDNAGSGKEKEDEAAPGVLTPEVIEALSAKHESLRIEDFAPYIDLIPLQETGSLWETLEFSYNGKTMYLRVSASDKDLVMAPYEGDLDGAVIFQEEFLGVETLEQEYAYEGSCADIRSGNLNNILNAAVDMKDYMTVSLPDGLVQSDYKYWMGSHGGVVFLKDGQDGQTEKITIENAGIYANKPLSGGIEIWGNGELAQNMETVRELEPLDIGEATLQRKVLQTEQGTRWFVAYTDRDGSSISYCFYLSEEEYTEAEFLAASSTIKLMEHAIY